MDRARIIVLNKIDLLPSEDVDRIRQTFEEKSGLPVFAISAVTRQGLDELIAYLMRTVPSLPKPILLDPVEQEKVYRYEEKPLYEVRQENRTFIISGEWARRLVASTNYEDPESMRYFQRQLRRKGVIDALKGRGIQEGESVMIDDFEFEYFE